jgi:hypothetical protein
MEIFLHIFHFPEMETSTETFKEICKKCPFCSVKCIFLKVKALRKMQIENGDFLAMFSPLLLNVHIVTLALALLSALFCPA